MTRIGLAALTLAASALVLPALAENPPVAPAPPATPATSAPAAPTAPAPADAAPTAPGPATPAPAAPPAQAANTGRLYISYPTQDKAAYDANFAIDDLWVADSLKSGTCVYFDLPAGDHKVHATTTPVWHVTLAAGATAYSDLRYRGGSINGLVPVEGSAPADVSACQQRNSPLG